jgi:hypothetical protein
MSPRAKWGWLVMGIVVTLLMLDFVRVQFRHVTFGEAREMADRRFLAYAEDYHLRTVDFAPPRIQDRGDEWLFEWAVLRGEGKLTVIVRRNGEIFDGGDEQLESSLKKK